MDYQQPPAIHQVAPFSGPVIMKDGSKGYMLMGSYVSEDEFTSWMLRQKSIPDRWKLKVMSEIYSR